MQQGQIGRRTEALSDRWLKLALDAAVSDAAGELSHFCWYSLLSINLKCKASYTRGGCGKANIGVNQESWEANTNCERQHHCLSIHIDKHWWTPTTTATASLVCASLASSVHCLLLMMLTTTRSPRKNGFEHHATETATSLARHPSSQAHRDTKEIHQVWHLQAPRLPRHTQQSVTKSWAVGLGLLVL